MTVLTVDFSARRLISSKPAAYFTAEESREQRVRRQVLNRCASLDIPTAMSQYQASLAAQSVRAGAAVDDAADRAVRRAIEGSLPGPHRA